MNRLVTILIGMLIVLASVGLTGAISFSGSGTDGDDGAWSWTVSGPVSSYSFGGGAAHADFSGSGTPKVTFTKKYASNKYVKTTCTASLQSGDSMHWTMSWDTSALYLSDSYYTSGASTTTGTVSAKWLTHTDSDTYTMAGDMHWSGSAHAWGSSPYAETSQSYY